MLVTTMSSTLPKTVFSVTFILSSACAFNLDVTKILSSGKGLRNEQEVLLNFIQWPQRNGKEIKMGGKTMKGAQLREK